MDFKEFQIESGPCLGESGNCLGVRRGPWGSGAEVRQAWTEGQIAQNEDERDKCPGYLPVCGTDPLGSL